MYDKNAGCYNPWQNTKSKITLQGNFTPWQKLRVLTTFTLLQIKTKVPAKLFDDNY